MYFCQFIGTGKTATFSISILQQIDTSIKECQALILAPTRELAQQVSNIYGDLLEILVSTNVTFYISREYIKILICYFDFCLDPESGNRSRRFYACGMSCVHWWHQCTRGYAKTGPGCSRSCWHTWKSV